MREGSARGQPREHGWRTSMGEPTALEPHYLLSEWLLPSFPQSLDNSSGVDAASLPGTRPRNPGLLLIDMVASAFIILCL